MTRTGSDNRTQQTLFRSRTVTPGHPAGRSPVMAKLQPGVDHLSVSVSGNVWA